ncbi:MAG: hypothetical protein JO023_09925, partial [Chloroflexi bacterium]|nr:hypothetical protein [Chloroflexota bacterium]
MTASINQGVVVGVFENRVDAEHAMDELRSLGFDADQLGFAMRDLGDSAPTRDESSRLLAQDERETGRDTAR